MQLFHFHHCKRHLKKRTVALDPPPPAYAVDARENDDNYGRPLTRTRTVIYWLSVPAITDSANKCHVIDGHFNPKSLAARTLSCDRQFAQIPMVPSGDRNQYFISRVNACVMKNVIAAIQTIWLHPFYDITS